MNRNRAVVLAVVCACVCAAPRGGAADPGRSSSRGQEPVAVYRSRPCAAAAEGVPDIGKGEGVLWDAAPVL